MTGLRFEQSPLSPQADIKSSKGAEKPATRIAYFRFNKTNQTL